MRCTQICLISAFVSLALAASADGAEDARPTGQGSPAPPADAVIAALPFEDSDEPNRIFIDLAPEGNRPLRVMLDTGATFTTFTPLFARSLGVTVRRTKSTPYRRATRLGRDLQFYIDTNSSDTGSRTGWEYGLLGGNFLQEYVVEFNFAARQVTFLNPKKFRVPEKVDAPNEAVVPIRVVSGRPIVKIGMNGKSIGVLLDTGAHDPMIMSGAAAKKLGVDVESLPPFGVFGTVLGSMPVSFYETESFTLGKFEFDLMPVMVAPKGWYNQGSNSDSVIGYDTLRQFTIRIDYPRERMWLRRVSTMVTYQGVDYALIRKAGLFLHAQPTAYVVTRVLADTPASRLGLQRGDALMQPGGPELADLDELIEKVVAGGPIRVMRQTSDGQWMETTLPEESDQQRQGGPIRVMRQTSDGQWMETTLPEESDQQRRKRLAEESSERDRAGAELWEREKKEALYYLRDGGWMKVDSRRRRKGPSDGEVWVNFEEMQRIKRGAEGGENQP